MAEDQEPNWGQYASYGLQMAVGVGLGVFVGRWVDAKWNCSPAGVLVGAMLGLGSGMYLLIKDTLRMNRDPGQGPDRRGSNRTKDDKNDGTKR